MKCILDWLVAAFAMCLLLLASGCEEEKSCDDCDDRWWSGVGNVQIVMGADTLRYLPGDSASTPVVVIVTTMDGNVMEGVKVAVALANPLIGILEFVDTDLRDTTNALGRVDLIYRSYATPGTNYVAAAAGGHSAIDSIVVEPAELVICDVSITISPDSVFGQQEDDSVFVTACLVDCDHTGIEGISLSFSANGGHFTPLPPTGPDGCAETVWIPPNEPGWWCLYFHDQDGLDSACVWVEP